MVNSVGLSNVSFGQVPQATANARQYMSAPYQNAAADTVEIAGKKKSKAGKAAIGIVAGLAVAGAALYGLFKTGKLTKVENASKWTEKLQNLAYKGGEGIDKGVNKVMDWGKGLIDKVKNGKKNPKTDSLSDLAKSETIHVDGVITADTIKDIVTGNLK